MAKCPRGASSGVEDSALNDSPPTTLSSVEIAVENQLGQFVPKLFESISS